MTTSPETPAVPRVGDYRLLAKIGEGGMGVVHLAQHRDGGRVALKVLRPHIIGDDEARERLAREVASLRRVTSPRIAEVIDADPWGETPYVATRYVPGLSLHQHVRAEGPIRGDDLTWFAACLAEAVIAVHQVGVLHRDIKPSNVLLEGRSPVLIDFGLARLAEDPRLTHTGWLLGTPGYLAPEILYGDDATTASDVHAWAATVVFASTGRPPFGTGPAMAIMDRVRRGEHDLTGVPASVLELVLAGLAPEPGDRPTTGAVVAALRAPAPGWEHPGPVRDDPTMPWMVADHGAAADSPSTRSSPTTKPLTVLAPPVVPPAPARAPFMTPAPATGTRPPLLPQGVRRPPPAVPPGCSACCSSAVGSARRRSASVSRRTSPSGLWPRSPSSCAPARGRWSRPASVSTCAVGGAGTTPLSRCSRRPGTSWSPPGAPSCCCCGPALLAGLVAIAAALFSVPLAAGLVALGTVFTLGLWSGPGSKRLRLPVRRSTAASDS